MNLNKREIQHW